jgi:hypothetical protein
LALIPPVPRPIIRMDTMKPGKVAPPEIAAGLAVAVKITNPTI